MCVFDGLFIFLLVLNTNDTDIKRKNILIHFKCSNSISVTSSLVLPPNLRLQFEYYPLNSTIKILYAFLMSCASFTLPPPNYSSWFDGHKKMFCENYEIGTSVL